MFEHFKPSTPRPQPANPPLDVKGRVVYQHGPWGTGRPVREASLQLVVRDRNFPTLRTAMGAPVDTDPFGFFVIKTPTGAPAGSVRPFATVSNHYTEAEVDVQLDGRLFVSTPAPQDLGDVVVSWKPPRPEVAWLDTQQFIDTRDFARALCVKLLQSTTYSRPMVSLFRETDSRLILPYTPAQELLRPLVGGQLPADFAVRSVSRTRAAAPANGRAGSVMDGVIELLKAVAQADINSLDKTPFLGTVLNGLAAALGQAGGITVEDTPVDAAVACTLLFIAGMMTRHKLKPSATFSILTDNERMLHRWLAVHVALQP